MDHLRTKTIIPFVGAGVSARFGYPVWQKFLMDFAEKRDNIEAVKELISKGFYERAAEELLDQRDRDDFIREIRLVFGKKNNIDNKKDHLGELLFKLFKGPVVTTNYDKLLEEIYKSHSLAFDGVQPIPEQVSTDDIFRKKEHYLIKIHGDIDNESTIILTETDYKERYRPGGIADNILAKLFAIYNFLFLGSSLQSDKKLEPSKR